MCNDDVHNMETDLVKLAHCPTHDVFHLGLGKATIYLTPREVLLLGAAINQWWQDHPEHLNAVRPFVLLPDPEEN